MKCGLLKTQHRSWWVCYECTYFMVDFGKIARSSVIKPSWIKLNIYLPSCTSPTVSFIPDFPFIFSFSQLSRMSSSLSPSLLFQFSLSFSIFPSFPACLRTWGSAAVSSRPVCCSSRKSKAIPSSNSSRRYAPVEIGPCIWCATQVQPLQSISSRPPSIACSRLSDSGRKIEPRWKVDRARLGRGIPFSPIPHASAPVFPSSPAIFFLSTIWEPVQANRHPAGRLATCVASVSAESLEQSERFSISLSLGFLRKLCTALSFVRKRLLCWPVSWAWLPRGRDVHTRSVLLLFPDVVKR